MILNNFKNIVVSTLVINGTWNKEKIISIHYKNNVLVKKILIHL